MIRSHRLTLASAAIVAAGTVSAAGTAGATTPPTTPDTASAEMTPAPDAITPDATPTDIVDESGTPVLRVAIVDVDPDWQDYGEFDEPDSGRQYVQVLLRIESLSSRGIIAIEDGDFALQDADGFLFEGDVVPTAAQTESDEDVPEEAELAGGDTVELPVTFEVVSGVAPDTLYYFPDSDRLVTLGAMSADAAAEPAPADPPTTVVETTPSTASTG